MGRGGVEEEEEVALVCIVVVVVVVGAREGKGTEVAMWCEV